MVQAACQVCQCDIDKQPSSQVQLNGCHALSRHSRRRTQETGVLILTLYILVYSEYKGRKPHLKLEAAAQPQPQPQRHDPGVASQSPLPPLAALAVLRLPAPCTTTAQSRSISWHFPSPYPTSLCSLDPDTFNSHRPPQLLRYPRPHCSSLLIRRPDLLNADACPIRSLGDTLHGRNPSRSGSPHLNISSAGSIVLREVTGTSAASTIIHAGSLPPISFNIDPAPPFSLPIDDTHPAAVKARSDSDRPNKH